MGLARMDTFVDIIKKVTKKDKEGFATEHEEVLTTVRAYREGRHGSERWANRAAFTDATDLFRFRKIPDLDIDTQMVLVCSAGRFEITSVEDVKGKGMYIEVLAREVKPSGKV